MAKISSLLKLRGTRFSPARRDGAASERQSSAPDSSSSGSPSTGTWVRKTGMAKALSRFKRQRVAEITDVATHEAKLTSVEALQPGNGSGVYVVERDDDPRPQSEAPRERRTKKMNPLLEQVTLVVYGWHNVEPGTLAWVFPSVGAAVAAARAMKNAVRWAIVAGKRDASEASDLDDARAHGAVLIEEGDV